MPPFLWASALRSCDMTIWKCMSMSGIGGWWESEPLCAFPCISWKSCLYYLSKCLRQPNWSSDGGKHQSWNNCKIMCIYIDVGFSFKEHKFEVNAPMCISDFRILFFAHNLALYSLMNHEVEYPPITFIWMFKVKVCLFRFLEIIQMVSTRVTNLNV